MSILNSRIRYNATGMVKSGFVIIIPILLALYLSWINRYFYFDDTLIYVRYVKNFINGYGLVYNKGEYYNGLTSPLFTYLSVGIAYILNNVILAINFLSALFLVLSIYTYHKIFSSVSNPLFTGIVSLLLVTLPYTYLVFGMETFLFIFLIGLSIQLFLQEKYGYLLTTLALLVLTRSEGVFLVVALIFEHFRLRRKFPQVNYFFIPIILVSVNFLFTYNYYGAFMSASGLAKIWQGRSGLWGDSGFIFITGSTYLFDWIFHGNKFFLTGLSLCSVLGVFSVGKKSLNFIVILFLALLLSFYTFLNIPNYHWYDAPFVVFLLYYAGVGGGAIYSVLTNYFKVKKVVILTLILSSLMYCTYNCASHLNLGAPHHPYEQIGLWLKNNTPGDASVAMVEIGIVGYFSNRYIIDILGLVNPFNAKYIGEKKFDK